MANPSLQIGNDNWAIKEDNLLGYSTAGTRFVPQPITMTRASAGTRVNPSGLVEDVELLGSELVTNGDFENNVIGWNKFKSNATESWNAGGYLDFTKTGESGRLGSDVSLETNKTYKISVNVISLGGILDLHVGIVDFESPYSGNSSSALTVGINTIYLTYPGSALSKGVYLQSGGTNYYGLTASIGSISVKEATINNLARVDYTDGTSSLLVEPQRTNLVTYSEDFSDSSWTKLGAGTGSTAVVTSNYAISPDGTQNATRLVCDLNGGTTTSDQSLIYDLDSSNTSQSISIYIKSNTGSNQNIYFANTFGTGDTSIVTSDWQRFEFNHSTSNHTFSLGLRGNTGADDTADILIWGAQSEESYATSYIPTSGSTVTRNQETYEKTGISDLINSEEGVLFVEMAALSDDSTDRRITMSDGTTQNRMAIGFDNASNKIKYFLISSNTIQVNKDISVSNITQFNKIAFKYKLNDFALWVNGVEVDTDTSGSTFSANTLSVLRFAGYLGTSQNFYGKVKQLQVFKTALTDSELATLTT